MKSGSRTIWLGLLAFALVAGIPAQFDGVAMAGTVDIFSQPGSGSNNMGGTNQGIPVSPVWATPPAGSEWISYGATGCNEFVALTGTCTPGPNNPPGTSVSGAPTATFYQTFTITDAMDYGILNVWADDTTGVWLDVGTVTSGDGSGGMMLYAPNGNLISNCSGPEPIGCLDSTGAAIPLNLTTGTYTLVFDAYQLVGASPFGVMYNGVLTDTPEPATYLLMGLGLAGLGTLVRRRKRA
ncbi:MAG: PEP-CTERM sorting domain-containing protein [Bryobacteraceae bacterium]